jgi:uncharacterized protein YggE
MVETAPNVSHHVFKEGAMKRDYRTIGVLTALFALLTLPAGAQDRQPGMSMDVTGQAVMSVAPNQAIITFTVETTDAKAASAVEKNAQRADRVIRALNQKAEKDINLSTSGFHIQPIYERDKKPDASISGLTPKAYRVSNSIVVKTGRIERIGELIDAAVAAGTTRIGYLSFSRSDSDILQRQAAAMALENAVENAKVLAKAAGLSLKGITYIQFVPNMMQPGGIELALAEGEAVTPILPGRITVESYVNLTYETTW